MNLKINPVPILKDNYAFVIYDSESSKALVIDPGEALPIENFLNENHLELKEIWITHHHHDHTDGLLELKNKYKCRVMGPKKEREKIHFLDKEVSDLDLLTFEGHPFKVLEFPGHTLGHIGYWFFEDKCLFSGDTLFSLGCGFLFEGTYQDMWLSLCKIRSLPEDTLIYCGHENTEENAKFASSVDPENNNLKQYIEKVREKRAKGEPTIPILLKDEMYINPFLRVDLPIWEKKLHMEDASAVKIFQKLREMKNDFKS